MHDRVADPHVIVMHDGQSAQIGGTLGEIVLALVNDPAIRLAVETFYCGELRVHYSPAEVEVFSTRKVSRRKRVRA